MLCGLALRAHPTLSTERQQGWDGPPAGHIVWSCTGCDQASGCCKPLQHSSATGSSPHILPLHWRVVHAGHRQPMLWPVLRHPAVVSCERMSIPRSAACSGCQDTTLIGLAFAACSPAGCDHSAEEALEEKGRHLHLL